MRPSVVFIAAAWCPALAALADPERPAIPSTSDEVRAVVSEMLADAESRTSLLAGGGDAGHDGRFFVSQDGFRLNVGGMVQFRYFADFRDEDTQTDEFQNGFKMRRLKLHASGVVAKVWEFNLQTDLASGSAILDDAWAQRNFEGGWRIRAGQFKMPVLREELISDAYQQVIERSIVNSVFSQQRSQGVQVSLTRDSWRCFLAVNDGLNARNTDFTGAGENTGNFKVSGEADWAVSGRAECILAGPTGPGGWKCFEDLTSRRGSDTGLMLGLAGHVQQSENSQSPADADRTTVQYTADLALEGDGWNIFGAFVGRYTDLRAVGGSDEYNDFGAVVQGGVYLAETLELYARWDALFLDDNHAGLGSESNFHFATVGLNSYLAGPAVRLSLDAVWSFNDTSGLQALGVLPDTGAGLLGDSEENEIVVRAQLQLIF